MALAAVTAGTGLYFHNRQVSRYTGIVTRNGDFRVAPDNTLPSLTMAKNPDPEEALNKALDAIGGIKRFIRQGDKVTIKPNIGWDRPRLKLPIPIPF